MRNRTYIWLILMLALAGHPLPDRSGGLMAQAPSYYLDGNEVVFVFDVRQYLRALDRDTAGTLDFRELGIERVAISGAFNNWSRKGWHMEQKSEFTFELRKPLKAFNDAFPLDFRYIINGRAAPSGQRPSQGGKHFRDDFLLDIYALDLSVLEVSDTGAIRFFLRGFPDARQVILSGSFNGWHEQAVQMHREADGWALRADLPPGLYAYKFIVDGEWMHDPENPDKEYNEHHTFNSLLAVEAPVTFRLIGYPDARRVALAGSFNAWREQDLFLRRVGAHWELTLPLVGGKHTYKFIVDGVWITDPANPVVEDDGNGNMNSVLFVH